VWMGCWAATEAGGTAAWRIGDSGMSCSSWREVDVEEGPVVVWTKAMMVERLTVNRTAAA